LSATVRSGPAAPDAGGFRTKINRLVTSGASWRAAVRGLLPGESAMGFGANLLDEAVANWMWLTKPLGRAAALDVGSRRGTLAAALSQHFARVTFQAHSAPAASFALLRFAEDRLDRNSVLVAAPGAYPYPHASFDCVAVSRLALAGVDGGAGALRHELAEWRRLLRVGGCLYVGLDNRWWVGRCLRWRDGARTSGRPQSPSQLARLLAHAGFRRIRVYYVEGAHDQLNSVVPRARRAVLAWARQAGGSRRSRAVRSLVTRLGLHALLFRTCIALAYR
jgi:SAM-dependent methyltransferase